MSICVSNTLLNRKIPFLKIHKKKFAKIFAYIVANIFLCGKIVNVLLIWKLLLVKKGLRKDG